MFNQHVHEVGVPHCVHCRDNDGVEVSIFGNWRCVLEDVTPWYPLPQTFLDKLIVKYLSLVREGNRERLGGTLALFINVVE